MHNRPNIKSMQTIGFSGKIVSALWRFKGRCLKIRWIRGPEVHCGGEEGGRPRDTSPGTFQCQPWEHLRPTLSTDPTIKSTVANFSDFGPDLRNLESEFMLRFLWWREVTAAV